MKKCKLIEQGKIAREGKKSVEFYVNYKAQMYCLGVMDKSKYVLFEECRECEQYITRKSADIKKAKQDPRNKVL